MLTDSGTKVDEKGVRFLALCLPHKQKSKPTYVVPIIRTPLSRFLELCNQLQHCRLDG